MNRISIEGKEYPCYVTMGAFVEFRKETGREASEVMESAGMCDMLAFLYSVVKSASRREKVNFSMTFEEFADAIRPDELPALMERIQEESTDAVTAPEVAKKKLPES